MTHTQAIELLDEAARELAEIHRGRHYALWRDEKRHSLGNALRQVSPFDAYSDSWIFTGDGGGAIAQGRFGDWAIDRLVEKLEPAAILAAFGEEIAGNVGHYSELSAILGVQLDATVDLGGGVTLDAEPEDYFEGMMHRIQFQMLPVPSGTSVLRHRYRVEPAFELRTAAPLGESVTTPAASARDQVRQRVRLACLLASIGPVEIPFSLLQPDRANLFVAGDGNQAGRPFAAMPVVAFPVEGADFGWLTEIEKDVALGMIPRSKADRLVLTERLVEAGLTLIREAEMFGKTALARAVGVRNGLLIALLALHPIRVKNFATLTIGDTFINVDGRWWLHLPYRDTKSRRVDERQVPEFISDAVNSYVNTHRTVLCRACTEHLALWVSSTTGQQLTTKNLGTLISKLTRETIGIDVSPHLFRTAGASTAAVYGGNHPHLASALLNHRDPRVTEEHYNRATAFSAGYEYAQITQFYRQHKSGD